MNDLAIKCTIHLQTNENDIDSAFEDLISSYPGLEFETEYMDGICLTNEDGELIESRIAF